MIIALMRLCQRRKIGYIRLISFLRDRQIRFHFLLGIQGKIDFKTYFEACLSVARFH